METGELLAIFSPGEEHQGYPGRLHGGIAAALLDEAIGRAIMVKHGEEIWGVTLEFSIKYRHPVPLDREIRLVARVTEEERRIFRGTGEILLSDGTSAVEGLGTYLRVPLERLGSMDRETLEWKVVSEVTDPDDFER